MIEIKISIDKDGCLRTLNAEGHSLLAPQGKNIVCAAVSSLLRSLVRVIEANEKIVSTINVKSDGFLSVEIRKCSYVDWLSGVSEVILSGLLEVERDYPLECKVELLKGA